jgi:hypothetical protein
MLPVMQMATTTADLAVNRADAAVARDVEADARHHLRLDRAEAEDAQWHITREGGDGHLERAQALPCHDGRDGGEPGCGEQDRPRYLHESEAKATRLMRQ